MKKKREGWPRWAKILRNLLLAALLGFMIWDLWDQPTLSYTEDLRRRERMILFPEPAAEVEFNISGGMKYRVELADDMAVTSYPARGKFFTNANASVWRLKEGPHLLCVPLPVDLRDEAGQPMSYAAYVAVHPPEDAAAAVLTLHMEEGDYVIEGIREGEVFLFYARLEPDEDGRVSMGSFWFWLEKLAYELEFFDKDENSICQVSGQGKYA